MQQIPSYKRLHMHFVLPETEEFEQNKRAFDVDSKIRADQDFSLALPVSQLQAVDERHWVVSEFQQGTGVRPSLLCVGANVSLNAPRSDLQLSSEFRVPVMLWSKGKLIIKSRVYSAFASAEEKDASKKCFEATIAYQLPSKAFPSHNISSLYKVESKIGSVSKLVLDDPTQLQQKWSWCNQCKQMLLFAPDYSMAILLTIDKVLTDGMPREPLAFFIDRVYALRQIAVFLDPAKLPMLND